MASTSRRSTSVIEFIAKTGQIVQDSDGLTYLILVDEKGSTDDYYRIVLDATLVRKFALESTGIALKATLK